MAQADDPARDFCLWSYPPVISPSGGLRSSNLLWQSLEAAGAPSEAFDLCREIRALVGPFSTVFGIKRHGATTSWELYFYDYQRFDRRWSANAVLDVAREFLGPMPDVDSRRPYFMFSFEFSVSMSEDPRPRCVDVYVGTGGDGISAGLCYSIESEGTTTLKNLYHFYDAQSQRDRAWRRLTESVRVDARSADPADANWPISAVCESIVVAHKRRCDGLYFTHLDIDQLIEFLAGADPRHPSLPFLRTERNRLRHLRHDVGLDLAAVDGRWVGGLTSFFGIL